MAKLVADVCSQVELLRGPSLPHGSCTRYQCVLSLLYLRCSFPSIQFLSAVYGHPHVPWWSSLVPASSINWRRRTPAHQDGVTLESRNFACICRALPIPCPHTHAILAGAFPPLFPFPDDELGLYPTEPRIAVSISAIKHTCLAVAGSSSPVSQALEIRSNAFALFSQHLPRPSTSS